MASKGKVGIVGSGFIGRGWAMLFASVGYEVKLFDVEPSKIDDALADIKIQLNILEEKGDLRGHLLASEQFSLISRCDSLKQCVEDSIHVQECVFENVDLKRKVFKEMDAFASNNVVLCSSTSCFPASSFSEDLVHKAQVIVGHPVNPPYYVPLVEVIPAPWTDPDVVTRTKSLMTDIGQRPVILKKEVPGFAVNRIQYALLDECWRIFRDGIMSVEDIDTSMHEGLGLRYAFIGPLETCHLNADGMLDYCNRYGQGIYKVSETFGPNPKMEGELAEKVHEEISKISPVENLVERRRWRDARLTALARMKRILNERDKLQ
ncbi:lambda-crystallin homolog [Trichonephila inaurata madagascariensis]|uniref:L-gulonate 3-dehydrogenase n=1 Tax=Trichonephila inaurata madagascariensis TaxID=2747483 RepID=A0A8X6XNL7_9ARAC|nr:lambda-crystallin homolog [Trichonephila inaurata madagascariensis]